MTSLFRSILFGGDYNPEQWPSEVWDEDVKLMQQAHVTTATVGVFSWAKLEPRCGQFEFGWLDDVLDRLHSGGIRVILATATASPPAWMAHQFPETLPVTANGVRLGFGSRQQYSPNSAVYRQHAARLVHHMASRFGTHPALEAWHINNEYSGEVAESFDDESVRSFRRWLSHRYKTIDELNRAWGTAVWAQDYGSFHEVDAPRQAPSFLNPTQLLDWRRFNSDAFLELFETEKAILREMSPNIPVTTNFMGMFESLDYWKWAEQVDFVSDDHYPDPADPESATRAAATRDLMRSMGNGRPWILMEQSPSAVNWRARNAVKPPGMNRLHALQSIARGADGVLHFQWRQAVSGAEKFHAAMLPHAGTDTRVHREIRALGAELEDLSKSNVFGAAVHADVGLMWDWESWWALSQPAVPAKSDYPELVLRWYAAFLRRGVTVDFVRPGSDLSTYSIIVAPALQLASPSEIDEFGTYVDRGVTC